MYRGNVRLFAERVDVRAFVSDLRSAFAGDYAAAEHFGNFRNSFAYVAETHYTPCFSRNFGKLRSEPVRDTRFGVFSRFDIIGVFAEVHNEFKRHGDSQLRHAIGRISGNISHGNAFFAAFFNINVVKSRCSLANEF